MEPNVYEREGGGGGPDMLIPLGTNSMMIHSEQHTMSRMVLVRERHQAAQQQHRTEDIC